MYRWLILLGCLWIACGLQGCSKSTAKSTEEMSAEELGLTKIQTQAPISDAVTNSSWFAVGSDDGSYSHAVNDYATFDPSSFISNSYVQMPPGVFQCARVYFNGLKGMQFPHGGSCSQVQIARVAFKNYVGLNDQGDHFWLWFCDAQNVCEFIDWLTFAPGVQPFSSPVNRNIDSRGAMQNTPWTPAQLGCNVMGYPSFGYCTQPIGSSAYWDASQIEIYTP